MRKAKRLLPYLLGVASAASAMVGLHFIGKVAESAGPFQGAVYTTMAAACVVISYACFRYVK